MGSKRHAWNATLLLLKVGIGTKVVTVIGIVCRSFLPSLLPSFTLPLHNAMNMATGGTNLSKEFFELLKAIGESKSKQEEDRIILSV